MCVKMKFGSTYICNIHLFHGNIQTHNCPAPNIHSFIAYLDPVYMEWETPV